ncbi:MAG TPA: hypothetical protein VGJ49_00190 [Gaiellaceae bacterium]
MTKVGIFTRRTDRDVVAQDETVQRDREVADRRGDWGGPPLVRALFTLAGAATAGLLLWLAQLLNLTSTNEFWAAMGIIAGAGLVLGLSQLLGGWTKWGIPVLSPGVFLLAFVPTAVVVGWILLVTQPEGGWYQHKFQSWSASMGIEHFVRDMGMWRAVLAFGLGIVFAFCFDTTGPRQRDVVDRERDVVPDEDVHDYDRGDVVTTPAGTTTDTTVRDRTAVPAGDVPDDRVDIRDPNRRETL